MKWAESSWRPFEQCRENMERARREREREAAEAEETLRRALRNGMPPSGRWA